MRALLVTSRVTFVPRNYDSFVLALADSPQVCGLLVLDNRQGTRLRALAAWAMGARGIGRQLLVNGFGWRAGECSRRRAFTSRGKSFHVQRSINERTAVALLRELDLDVVVNARTREIYGGEALSAPRLGCLNVHHGLLPAQRGLMCDLWALYTNEPAGFSIHAMTRRVDDGEILRAVAVSHGERDYLAHLAASAAREAGELAQLLDQIGRTGVVEGRPNRRTAATVYRRNPTWSQIRQMRAAGLRL